MCSWRLRSAVKKNFAVDVCLANLQQACSCVRPLKPASGTHSWSSPAAAELNPAQWSPAVQMAVCSGHYIKGHKRDWLYSVDLNSTLELRSFMDLSTMKTVMEIIQKAHRRYLVHLQYLISLLNKYNDCGIINNKHSESTNLIIFYWIHSLSFDSTFLKDVTHFGVQLKERQTWNVKVRLEVKCDMIFGCKL